MLCPEIWKFKAPELDLVVEKGDVLQNFCLNKINNFFFNHLVSVTIPDSLSIPKCLSNTLITDCEYYKICNLNINEIINSIFINSFVKSGNLTLLSINSKIDCDNCVSIVPSKKLILSLTKETYQALGLEGSVSHFCTSNKYKYIVKVDLVKLLPGTKTFERTKNCLKRLPHFDVILIWEPPDVKICPSSIAKYFDTLNYEIKLCVPKYDMQVSYSVKTPIIDFTSIDKYKYADYIEWLGMLHLNADLETGSAVNYITTYEVPEPNTTFGQISTVTWMGFFTNHKIQLLFNELRKYQQENNKPWISLFVQGFSDSPVGWGEREHHYYTNGDNTYTILLNSKNYLMHVGMCSYKRYNKKEKNKRK